MQISELKPGMMVKIIKPIPERSEGASYLQSTARVKRLFHITDAAARTWKYRRTWPNGELEKFCVGPIEITLVLFNGLEVWTTLDGVASLGYGSWIKRIEEAATSIVVNQR